MTVPAAAAFRLSALCEVHDALEVNLVSVRATAIARAHGFGSDAADRVRDVATEMAANIVRHAGHGQVILRAVGDGDSACIEVLALDKGPGIGNMNRAMRDTPAAGTPSANGLFTVKSVADFFDIFSHPSHGTAVVAHVSSRAAGTSCRCASMAGPEIGAICIPVHGEEECGDAWAVESVGDRTIALLVDGLGHGPHAAIAAKSALAVFAMLPSDSPESLMSAADAALHSTRGAAVSVVSIDWTVRTARFFGVGNAEGRIVTLDSNRHMIPQNGIVGHNMPRIQPTEMAWPAGGRLVMHSDGIASRWRIDRYPGLLARHPALIAGVLFRDFSRARDDATVLVLRERPATLPG